MSRACLLGKLIVCSIKNGAKGLFSHLRVRRRRPAAGCGGDGTVSVTLHEEEILVGSNPRPALHSCAWTHTAICWPAEVSHISRLFSRLLKLAASAVCSQPEPVAARRVLLPAATASWDAPNQACSFSDVQPASVYDCSGPAVHCAKHAHLHRSTRATRAECVSQSAWAQGECRSGRCGGAVFALTSPPRRRAETSAECSLGRWEWAEAATGRRIPSRAAGPS